MNRDSLEILVSVALIAVGAAAFATIGLSEDSASPFLLAQERALGSLDYATFPRVFACGLMILSAVNVLLLLRKRGKRRQETDTAPARQRRIRLLTMATAVLTFAYIVALAHVNFIVITAAFLFVMFRLYGLKRLQVNAAVAMGGAVLFWVVFVKLSHLAI